MKIFVNGFFDYILIETVRSTNDRGCTGSQTLPGIGCPINGKQPFVDPGSEPNMETIIRVNIQSKLNNLWRHQ